MAVTHPQNNQIVNEAALSKLGLPARTSDDVIMAAIDTNFDAPLRMAASFPTATAVLNFSAQEVTRANGTGISVAPLSSTIPTVIASSVNFQTGATTGTTFSFTLPTGTLGFFRRCGFSLASDGTITALFGAEAATLAATPNPGALFVPGSQALGWVDLECTNATGLYKTAGSATDIIENSVSGTAVIHGFGSGSGSGGSGTGSGVGDDLNSLRFRASFTDVFSESSTTATSAVASSLTTGVYDTSKQLYRMSYDASKTVTGTGTSMTISGTPSFTVAVGDILVVGTEARRITAIPTQTTPTIEAAFTVDPSAAACTLSQVVHTNDVRAHTENSTGLSIASQITDSVSTYMLSYKDSSTSGDTIPDVPGAALIAFSATADSSSWSAVGSRVTGITVDEPVRTLPTSGSQFKARFFAAATSGTGAVNLLDYKVYLHEDTGVASGNTYDMAYCLTSGAGTEVNCSVASDSGKTRVTTTWNFALGVNAGSPTGQIEVFVDGKKLPRYIDAVLTPDGSYLELSSNTIELDSDYSSFGLSVEIRKPVPVIDVTNQNSSAITGIQGAFQKGFQGFVDESATVAAPNTLVVGRKTVPDFSKDMMPRIGIDRIMTMFPVELQDEFGPNGEKVYAVLGDDKNLIRFVGTWASLTNNTGNSIYTPANWTDPNDFVEITFYGTGLNVLITVRSGTVNSTKFIDGVSSGTVAFGGYSVVQDSRNWAENVIVPVTSGLTQGLHTVRLQGLAGNGSIGVIHGFEILNETSTIGITAGSSYADGKKLLLTSPQALSYNTTFDSITRDGATVGSLSTRGSRVLVYHKADGTIGKSAIEANSAAAYITSANHTNEEVSRVHLAREFGAGRADDFSFYSGGSTALAFVLDDDTTGLIGVASGSSIYQGFTLGVASSSFLTLTFVGTGLDVSIFGAGGNTGLSPTFNILVDGVTVNGGGAQYSLLAIPTNFKVVSGLPYGTHTVMFAKTTANGAFDLSLNKFTVYQPKTPALPSGAAELGSYNLLADYAQLSSLTGVTDKEKVSSGVLRKHASREVAYTGTWSVPGLDPTNLIQGFNWGTTTNGSFYEYTFFGTGIELRTYINAAVQNWTVAVDGSSALSGFSTNLVQGSTGVTWTASTGALAGTSAAAAHISLKINGLTYGKHTIKVTRNGNDQLYGDALDIITPVHAPKFNAVGGVQNTLPVGSCAISDSRKLSPVKSESPKKAWAQADGALGNLSSTVSDYVPIPDLSVVIKTSGNPIQISWALTCSGTPRVRAAVNGVMVGAPGGNGSDLSAGTCIVPVPAGIHHVGIYWKATGTSTSYDDGNTGRIMNVREI